MRRTALTALAVIGLTASLASCGEEHSAVKEGPAPWQTTGAGEHGAAGGGHGETKGAEAAYKGDIVDAAGKKVGTVAIAKAEHGMNVTVTATSMAPGFHGTHLHSVGKCEPKSADPADAAKTGDFLSAGGHLKGAGSDHPLHAGDLPMLYVGADGTGSLTANTDRLTDQLLGQAAGVSLIVHGGADNYGNIPTRYATAGPDADTLKAGDSGARAACAVLKKA